MEFRKDINGLRAIAVLAVVLFHFNAPWLSGGFAGVDVFFVISGFLMTRIIFTGIENGNFSILNFYVARANRIVPALAVLCLVLLVFGWFYLSPLDYRFLGKHVASSIGFLSNVIYWSEAGYFDAASQGKWLLHTWSLSTEWQFYIAYPLILVFMSKFITINAIKRVVLAGTIVGFIYCLVTTYLWPSASYYLLPARAWEMMIGGIAYLYPMTIKADKRKALELAGLALIIGSYILISKEQRWPGALAIFPVMGSFFIIQAQVRNSFITNNVFSQKIGDWSYSIYIWHWPLVVAIYYFSLSDIYIYLGIMLSIVLGFLSYKYVEKLKFRKNFSHLLAYAKCKPLHIVLVTGVLGSLTFLSNGFESHYPEHLIAMSKESLNKNPYKCMEENKFPCYIGNKENIKAIIVGDSHADALTTAVAHSVNIKNEGIIALTMASCPFIMNIMFTINGDKCYKENIRRMEYLASNHLAVPIFWVSRTSAYLYGQSAVDRIVDHRDKQPSIYFTKLYNEVTDDLLKELSTNLNLTMKQLSISHPVYIVQPIPEMKKDVPKTLAKNIILNEQLSDLSIDYSAYLHMNKAVRSILSDVAISNGIKVLDPAPYLCNTGKCIAQLEGRPIYFDGDHMSEYGNKILVPMFKSALDNHYLQ